MAYSKFKTFDSVTERLGVEIVERPGLFGSIASISMSPEILVALEQNLPLATAIYTEKARSELIVMPMLLEIWNQMERKIGLFSGIELNVDRKLGLDGYCDFLLSLDPLQSTLRAPVVTIVETKRVDPGEGVPQCIAEMIAAQKFNADRGSELPVIYGVATSGVLWRFLQLKGNVVEIDLLDYSINEPGKVVGILLSCLRQAKKQLK
jgi:hypothetical protein